MALISLFTGIWPGCCQKSFVFERMRSDQKEITPQHQKGCVPIKFNDDMPYYVLSTLKRSPVDASDQVEHASEKLSIVILHSLTPEISQPIVRTDKRLFFFYFFFKAFVLSF